MKHKIRYIGKIRDTKAYLMVRNDVLYILYNYFDKTFKVVLFEEFEDDDFADIEILNVKTNIINTLKYDIDSFYFRILKDKNDIIRKAKLLYIEQYV